MMGFSQERNYCVEQIMPGWRFPKQKALAKVQNKAKPIGEEKIPIHPWQTHFNPSKAITS